MKTYFSRKKRLLAITEIEELSAVNVYRSRLVLFFIYKLGLNLKPLYINHVFVKYKDKSHKQFDLPMWIALRGGIIKNLYQRGLCSITFIRTNKPYEITNSVDQKTINKINKILKKKKTKIS